MAADYEGYECSTCGADLGAQDSFCPGCGKALESPDPSCPSCGRGFWPGDAHCRNCGTELDAPGEFGSSEDEQEWEAEFDDSETDEPQEEMPQARPLASSGFNWSRAAIAFGIGLVLTYMLTNRG